MASSDLAYSSHPMQYQPTRGGSGAETGLEEITQYLQPALSMAADLHWPQADQDLPG